MRTAFINTLTELARSNKDIFLLTGDVGFSVFENFKREFPDRFFDVGVAEQNMIGIAAGLSLSGKRALVYSITPFVTMRCLEHTRNDLCMQNLNVKIVGMGTGLDYGFAGPTHHAIEDISLMRSLPNMTVICPSTPREAGQAMESAFQCEGPVYIRLSKSKDLREPGKEEKFCIGRGILIEDGTDITVISTGSILYNAKRAADSLKKEGIHTRLINIHTIKPIDKDIILEAGRETRAIFTIEEHNITGGLGTAVAEVLAESNLKVYFKRIALPDVFVKDVGSREYLLRKNNLTEEEIVKTILREIKNRK